VLIDTHCHLDAGYFPEGPDAAIERAKLQGVDAFVVVGVGSTLEQARQAVALAARRPDCHAVTGVHPHDASAVDAAMLDELEQLAASPHVVAVGEIGLDYHYLRSPREAADDTIALLTEEGAKDVGGIIHCFSEDRPFAQKALDLGFDLSFSGIVTFKTARSIQDVAAWAPIDRILVETDSPYLAPIPFRGKPCEPAHVLHTARRVAELRGMSLEDLAARTSANARRRLRF
jgi:TatD DNase family protein